MDTAALWRVLAPVCVLLAGSLWGIIGLFSNPLSGMGFSSIQITELRTFVTAAALLPIILIYNPSLLRIRVGDIWMFLCTGIGSIVLFNVCYFLCISRSTLSIACTLLYTGPCFVMLLSRLFFHEKLTAKKVVALILAVTGCAFITGMIGTPDAAAVGGLTLLIGLGSGLGYGLYSIFSRVALRRYHWLTVNIYTFAVAALVLLPFSHPAKIIVSASQQGTSLLFILMLGLVSTLLPFLLYTNGLHHMETSKAAVFTFVEPMFATIISITVFGEAFTPNHAVGMLAIVLSITLLNLKKH